MSRKKGKKTEYQEFSTMMAKADYILKEEEMDLKNKKDSGRDKKDRRDR